MSPERARILVVEDADALRRGIVRALRETFGDVDDAASGEAAIALLADRERDPYDVVVSDVRMPGADGMAVLEAARGRDARTSVLLMTAFGTIDAAVEAMRAGAFDFVQKPVDLEQLEARVARAVEHGRLLREVADLRAERARRALPAAIVGRSAGFRAAVELAERVAPTRSTVLVTGETGTGKEVIASLVHGASDRAGGPFVRVNCAALPETLLESELFGHERGAFTGADRVRIGRFEQAHGGTLFLDEIGDMSPMTQAKLLRVLQDQEFTRLGGTRSLRTDVRIVAATNRDLESAVREGRFREDLFFRLDVIRIALPPLRERPEDVEALARHFLAEFVRDLGRPRSGFTPEAMAAIVAHPWPGNVRELRNVIERAVLMANGERIDVADVGFAPVGLPAATGPRSWTAGLPAAALELARIERAIVLEALRRAGWVQKEAAGLLGISRRKLNYVIGRLGITHPGWRRHSGDGGEPSDPSPLNALRPSDT